VREVLTIESHL